MPNISVSILDSEVAYPEVYFYSPVPPDKNLDMILKQATITSFHILRIFNNCPTERHTILVGL
jgi:hypothetical protein